MVTFTPWRVGVIDVGSNSIRLVVFDGAARSPAYFFNEKVMCGLGNGLAVTGRLDPEGRVRALEALTRFATLGRAMGLSTLRAVATAAVRAATDGPDFVAEVAERTGLALEVVSGAEEARLAAEGVLLGAPGASGWVCDIGGASLELATLRAGQVVDARTSGLAPLQIRESGGPEAQDRAIEAGLTTLVADLPPADTLWLVGGSWRALVKAHFEWTDYPLQVLQDFETAPEDLLLSADRAVQGDLNGLRSINEARAALLPLAARVFGALVRRLAPSRVRLSAYGLREGLLFRAMDPETRARDPLIEAARFQENAARFPGSGDGLFAWLGPIRDRLGPGRLVHAACLLHDVAWRAHPDHRAQTCFDVAMRAALAGLTHGDRAFLAMALMHRYKPAAGKPAVARLLDEPARGRAVALGRALRLGAMVGGGVPRLLEATRLEITDGRLRLDLAGSGLGGERVEKRLAALAAALDLVPSAQAA